MLETCFDFLKDLEKNNNRPWFEAHRDDYERAKEAAEAFVFRLFPDLGIDRGSRKASAWFFRIHKDVRFSKDKLPYKTSFSCVLDPAGKNSPRSLGAYLHLQPHGQSLIAGGIWAPTPAQMKSFRLDMEDGPRTFMKILNNPEFQSLFKLSEEDRLKKVPRGFTEDHPAAEFLKLRHLVVWRPLTDTEVMAENFAAEVIRSVKVLSPFLRYMEHAVGMTGTED